jgi:hypothetical protein
MFIGMHRHLYQQQQQLLDLAYHLHRSGSFLLSMSITSTVSYKEKNPVTMKLSSPDHHKVYKHDLVSLFKPNTGLLQFLHTSLLGRCMD